MNDYVAFLALEALVAGVPATLAGAPPAAGAGGAAGVVAATCFLAEGVLAYGATYTSKLRSEVRGERTAALEADDELLGLAGMVDWMTTVVRQEPLLRSWSSPWIGLVEWIGLGSSRGNPPLFYSPMVASTSSNEGIVSANSVSQFLRLFCYPLT